MKLSEYIQELKTLLEQDGDAPCVFDDDRELDHGDIPEFNDDPTPAWVFAS